MHMQRECLIHIMLTKGAPTKAPEKINQQNGKQLKNLVTLFLCDSRLTIMKYRWPVHTSYSARKCLLMLPSQFIWLSFCL